MRGKLTAARKGDIETGLIPAHAGKTSLSVAGAIAKTAHPRACGENKRLSRFRGAFEGSSPRMRGKQLGPALGLTSRGLIPAHAGKTFLSLRAET